MCWSKVVSPNHPVCFMEYLAGLVYCRCVRVQTVDNFVPLAVDVAGVLLILLVRAL